MHPVVTAALICISFTACTSPSPRAEDVVGVMESFYGAMKSGDAAGAMTHIATDAVFVESGRLETRAEYEKNHLPADIDFERQVTGRRSPWEVKFDGDTAWGIATTEFVGTFEGGPVDFVSAQLAVLTREDGRWRIRSIHWSSHRR